MRHKFTLVNQTAGTGLAKVFFWVFLHHLMKKKHKLFGQPNIYDTLPENFYFKNFKTELTNVAIDITLTDLGNIYSCKGNYLG